MDAFLGAIFPDVYCRMKGAAAGGVSNYCKFDSQLLTLFIVLALHRRPAHRRAPRVLGHGAARPPPVHVHRRRRGQRRRRQRVHGHPRQGAARRRPGVRQPGSAAVPVRDDPAALPRDVQQRVPVQPLSRRPPCDGRQLRRGEDHGRMGLAALAGPGRRPCRAAQRRRHLPPGDAEQTRAAGQRPRRGEGAAAQDQRDRRRRPRARRHRRRQRRGAGREERPAADPDQPAVPPAARQLAMAILIPSFTQLTGINAIGFYTPVLLRSIGMGESASLLSAIVLVLVTSAATFISMLAADRFGRRTLLLAGGAQMLVSEVLIGAIMVAKLGDEGGLSGAYALALLLLIGVYSTGFGWSWGPLSWLVPSEIFPLEVRSAGQSVTVASSFVFTILVAQFFLAMLCRMKAWIFFFFAGWIAAMTAFVYLFLPETRRIPIEQIDKVWGQHWFWRWVVGVDEVQATEKL